MEPIERIVAGLDRVAEFLGRPEMEPNSGRTDWAEQARRIRQTVATFREQVLQPLATGGIEVDEETDVVLRISAINLGSSIVALLHVSGHSSDAVGMLDSLREIAPARYDSRRIQEIEAAERDITHFALLMYGRWLVARDAYEHSEAVFDQVCQHTSETVLAEAARTARAKSRPIDRAPALFRYSGFGLGMYGQRDRDGDSFVATHCISALWIPILPLNAYRVVMYDRNTYGFLAEESLSRVAIWYRRIALAALAAVVLSIGVTGYFEVPERLARVAFNNAQAAAAAGDTSGAIAQYEALLVAYSSAAEQDVIGDSGHALVQLYTEQVGVSVDRRSVTHAVEALRRYDQLPTAARNAAAAAAMEAQVLQWSETIGQATPADIEAGLALLNEAAVILQGQSIQARRRSLQIALAKHLARDWPLAALALCMDAEPPGPDGVLVASAVIARLGQGDALWRAAEQPIERWLKAAVGYPDLAEAVEQARGRLDAAVAKGEDAARGAVLAGNDEAALAAFWAQHPGDQEVALALAAVQHSQGNAASALQTLTDLGEPGWLIPAAQQQLASLLAESGRLGAADALLTRVLGVRLPRLQAASRAYRQAFMRKQAAQIARVEAGAMPPVLVSQLRDKSEAEQQQIFVRWMGQEFARDAELAVLRAAYMKHADAVALVASLGAIKRRRANAAQGPERAALIEQAGRLEQAAQMFWSIRADTTGVTGEHHHGRERLR